MAWCCVVDVCVLFFFCFGDGVLIFWDKLINIDEHFDRVSTQNLKFQFDFVYCAPLGKPV